MRELLFYIVSSFWAGAVHAATPGHGKTIAAAYLVGARGKPIDAVILGVFVTLSHTSGIVLVGVLASLGSAWLVAWRTVIRASERGISLVSGVAVMTGSGAAGGQPCVRARSAAISRRAPGLYVWDQRVAGVSAREFEVTDDGQRGFHRSDRPVPG